jgi:hypothetical protein
MLACADQWNATAFYDSTRRNTYLRTIAVKGRIFIILLYCLGVKVYRGWPVMQGKSLVALDLQFGRLLCAGGVIHLHKKEIGVQGEISIKKKVGGGFKRLSRDFTAQRNHADPFESLI